MEDGQEYVINTDSIDAVARQMALAGISFRNAAEAFAKVCEELSVYIGKPKVMRRHIRHKQIERARALMQRGQKGA